MPDQQAQADALLDFARACDQPPVPPPHAALFSPLDRELYRVERLLQRTDLCLASGIYDRDSEMLASIREMRRDFASEVERLKSWVRWENTR